MPPDPPEETAAKPDDDDEAEPATSVSPTRFRIVGVGASAGGLQALETVVSRLGSDPIALIVMQHQAPTLPSMLPEILARSTKLRVVRAADGLKLEPGTVYVAPPGQSLGLRGDVFVLTDQPHGPVPHTIDTFFRSLAGAAAERAIAVVLSGTGSDGSLGIKAVRDTGGIVFAQDPATAGQPGMPQSAIDTGCVDAVLSPEDIGDELARLGATPVLVRTAGRAVTEKSALARVFVQLRTAHGVDFSQYKPTTVERRIARRMALHKLESVDDYLAFLGSDGNELRALYGDLLIGVTGFFRDPEAFDLLVKSVFRKVAENRPAESAIRIWAAGCSTGEEAYSIAITLLEALGDQAHTYRIQIFATDIDEDALSRARLAVYPASIELDVSPERLQRFFVRVQGGYQVARRLRDLVVFARHNLGKDPPFSRLDLVTCRNVLIYMQTPLQRKVLRVFHYALNPDGHMLLGASESVGDVAELFTLMDRKLKLYARRNVVDTPAFELALLARDAGEEEGPSAAPDRRPLVKVAQVADRKVIEKYAPPGVIVDEKLDAMQFRGRTGPYLEPAPGVATLGLLKLARPELVGPIRTTVHAVLAQNVPASSPTVLLPTDEGLRSVVVDVIPLPDESGRRCLLVLFNEAREPKPSAPESDADAPADDPRVEKLERELGTTREYLQSTIEELEAANEELQSSNEELQSSNEELQSTNEELETSKEELQSTNEELATVNDELHSRMGQLGLSNDDLQNVLANVSSAVVVIGADLRVRRASAAAEKLLGLTSDDVGRPIAYLRNVISARDVEKTAADAIESIRTHEQRVRCIDGGWYLMRMIPYRTTDLSIRGLVLEFTKASPPSAAEADPVPPAAAHLLSGVPQPLILVDAQLRLTWANRAFFDAFAVSPASVGRPLVEVWGSPDGPAELWTFLDEVASGRATRDVLIEHPFGRSAGHPVRLSGRLVSSEDGRTRLSLITIQDV
ncbi:MAG TPA: CheR family methyltransferase [Polyangiaceae bacterium]|jgi:two-component system CheB/CheR fusion protein